ncbi:MAG: DUF4080 domain-containing protein, partial [Desulfobulbales bacterium]|nr:DUF4080 domain-containing protein [Desulfobulbales bacterium]
PEIAQYTINDPYYPTLRSIAAGKPAALFFSVYIWNSKYIQRLAGDLVKLLPGTPIILGGPQAGAMIRSLPPEVSQHCTVVTGEIEGVDKSFYVDLSRGELQKEYSCAKVSAFSSPYRAEDFAGPLKNRHIYYESSRGCPFSCTYCLSASEKGVRRLPPEQVKKEIGDIVRHSPKVIRFVDRTFNEKPDRTLEIWSFLAQQPGQTLFHFEMAPDRFTEEMFRFLEQLGPGRFQFELGVQSTNPQTLKAIKRTCDLEKLAPGIRRLVSLGTIHVHLDLILGLPYETWDTFSRSFAEVFHLGPHYIQMGLLKVLPDTSISESIEKYHMLVCENPPYEILANKWLNTTELEELFWFGECVEAFFNNRYFRSFWEYLRNANEDIFLFFQALLQLCRAKGFFGLAPTQELLSSLLLAITRGRPDMELLRELLIFDWLRCGHHFLPDHLSGESLARQKKMLRQNMDQNWEGVYDYKNRDEFFKQGVFWRFSGNFMKEAGLAHDGKSAYVCFTAAREDKVFNLSRIVLIPLSFSGSAPE